jgi:hypothetical protein
MSYRINVRIFSSLWHRYFQNKIFAILSTSLVFMLIYLRQISVAVKVTVLQSHETIRDASCEQVLTEILDASSVSLANTSA